MMRLFVAGLSLCMIGVVWAEQPQYMVVAAKELRNGMQYKVDVTLLESQSHVVDVHVSIRKQLDATSDLVWDEAYFTITIDTGSQTGTDSVLVPFDVMTSQQYFLHLSFNGLSVEPVNHVVTVTRPISSLFVQTNQGIYKPGSRVLCRAVVTDEKLMILDEMITLTIKDPMNNNVMQLKSAPSNGNGPLDELLVSGEYTISNDPVIGEYRIIAETNTRYIERFFTVERYVLPKYEVILTLDDDYVIDGDNPTVAGKVEAKYSYGSSVKGKMVLKINDIEEPAVYDFDGSARFNTTVRISNTPWMRGDWYRPSITIKISADVTEVNTHNTMNDSQTVKVYSVGFAATLMPLPMLFQGHTQYTFQVKLTDPTGGRLTSAANHLSRYRLFYKARADTTFQNVSVEDLEPQTVQLTMKTSDDNLYDNEIEVFYEYTSMDGSKKSSPHVRGKVSKYYTYSQSTIDLQVTGNDENQGCFTLTPFESTDTAFYQVINNYQPESILPYTQTSGHCFSIEREHAPRSKVVVYKLVTYNDGTTDQIELLTASVDINVEWTPEQTVTLSVVPQEVKPGESVEILIQTTGPAIVAISSLDKSSTFLKAANDIKYKDMLAAVQAYRLFDRPRENPTPNPPMFPGGPMLMMEKPDLVNKRKKRCSACISSEQYTDPKKILESAGLLILTDLPVKRQDTFATSGDNVWREKAVAMAVPRLDNAVAESDNEVDNIDDEGVMEKEEIEEPAAVVRDYFPETWLWDVETTDTNGAKTITKTAPDSITNWVLNAFAFNGQSGLGVAETQELTVKQAFFISMDLPYSTIRGESFYLKILVFNYESSSLEVTVVLASTSSYTIEDASDLGEKTILSGTSTLFRVNITMKEIGNIPLRATATQKNNVNNVDIVERELLVKPEGREIRQETQARIAMPQDNLEVQLNMSHFFKIGSLANGPLTTRMGFVEGSLRMYLQFTGDMMSPFIESIGKQIRMPSGCGEQNIKSLTPSVFVARYLNAINRFEAAIEAKVRRVCGVGYRKELVYLHQDGSYSAFGDRPNLCQCGMAGRKMGSTWLTAYVLKTFSLVYLDGLTYIDLAVLKKSFDYIANNASHAGCDYQYFVEEGELIHTEMQGGTTSRFGFNAFVLIAIIDYRDAAMKAGYDIQEADTTINKSSTWLRKQKEAILESKQQYQIAISAYALARASNGTDVTSIELLEKYEDMMSESSNDSQSPMEETDNGECIYVPGSENVRKTCSPQKPCENKNNENNYWYRETICCRVACGNGEKLCMQKPGPFSRSTSDSSQVEMRGYALMAYLQLYKRETDATRKAFYKLKADELKEWLLSVRKGNGFFHSTQDTVVAFEALAQYALTFNNSVGAQYTIKAKSNGTVVSNTGTVTQDTNTVNFEEMLDVTEPTNDVSVIVDGQFGTAYINLVALYNVNKDVTIKPFDVTIGSGKSITGDQILRHCFNKNKLFMGKAGTMIVTSTTLPTGLTYLDIISPTAENLAPSKVEVEENKIDVYYMNAEDNFSEERCVNFVYREDFVVKNRKPALSIVTDYYKTENSIEVLYSIDTSDECLGVDCPTTTGASSACLNMLLVIAAGTVVFFARSLQ